MDTTDIINESANKLIESEENKPNLEADQKPDAIPTAKQDEVIVAGNDGITDTNESASQPELGKATETRDNDKSTRKKKSGKKKSKADSTGVRNEEKTGKATTQVSVVPQENNGKGEIKDDKLTQMKASEETGLNSEALFAAEKFQRKSEVDEVEQDKKTIIPTVEVEERSIEVPSKEESPVTELERKGNIIVDSPQKGSKTLDAQGDEDGEITPEKRQKETVEQPEMKDKLVEKSEQENDRADIFSTQSLETHKLSQGQHSVALSNTETDSYSETQSANMKLEKDEKELKPKEDREHIETVDSMSDRERGSTIQVVEKEHPELKAEQFESEIISESTATAVSDAEHKTIIAEQEDKKATVAVDDAKAEESIKVSEATDGPSADDLVDSAANADELSDFNRPISTAKKDINAKFQEDREVDKVLKSEDHAEEIESKEVEDLSQVDSQTYDEPMKEYANEQIEEPLKKIPAAPKIYDQPKVLKSKGTYQLRVRYQSETKCKVKWFYRGTALKETSNIRISQKKNNKYIETLLEYTVRMHAA